MALQLPIVPVVVSSQCGFCASNVPLQRHERALLNQRLLNPGQQVGVLPAPESRPLLQPLSQPLPPYLNPLFGISET